MPTGSPVGSSRYLLVSRVIFVILIVASIFLGLNIGNKIEINTSLDNLAPRLQDNPQIQAATNSLNKNIEKSILFLLSSENEDVVYIAEDDLRLHLGNASIITVHPDANYLSEQLIKNLKPYRFSLLSTEQQQVLLNDSASEIAAVAKASLYNLSAQSRAYPFDDDPLGWHSATLHSLLKNNARLESNSENTALVSISINDDALDMRNQQSLFRTLDSIIKIVQEKHQVEIERSGVFFFAEDAAKNSKRDIKLISSFSTIGVVLLLLLTFRTSRALLLPVLSIGLGIVFAALVTHSVYGNIHILTIVFGASLIGIVIDYSLHYFYHKAHINSSLSGGDNSKQLENQTLHRALMLSLITSLIGYTALSFSELQALQKVALFSCSGLFMSWLCVICLGEYALRKPLHLNQTILPVMVKTLSKALSFFKPKSWLAFNVLAITAASIIVIIGYPFDDNPKYFFNAPQSLLASEEKVSAVANDHEPGRYIVISGKDANEVYLRHEIFFTLIKETNYLEIDNFTSLLNWVPSPESQHANYQQQALLYGPQSAAELLISDLTSDRTLIINIEKEYTLAKQRILTPEIASAFIASSLPPIWQENNNSVVNFILIKKGIKTESLTSLTESIEGVDYINTLKRTEQALTKQRVSATILLLLAYALISFIVLLRYRELSALWLVMVPICSSAILVIMSMILGFNLNLFHVMALFLVLGFGMDYMIFAREMQPPHDITLQAILLSALTSILSFGLLAVSSIPVVSSFGTTLLIGNLFNLFGVIIYSSSIRSGNPAKA